MSSRAKSVKTCPPEYDALARSIAGCFAHAKLPLTRAQKRNGQKRKSTHGKIHGIDHDIRKLAMSLCARDQRYCNSLRHLARITGTKDYGEQVRVVRDFLGSLEKSRKLFYNFNEGAWVMQKAYLDQMGGESVNLARNRRMTRKGRVDQRGSMVA